MRCRTYFGRELITEATAVIYEAGKGMEDGFICNVVGCHPDITGADCDKCQMKQPYIGASKNVVNVGDYIVIDKKGNKGIMSPEDFHQVFRVVKEDQSPSKGKCVSRYPRKSFEIYAEGMEDEVRETKKLNI
jgi:hypothetical protein